MKLKMNWYQKLIMTIKERIRKIRSRMAYNSIFSKYRTPRPLDEDELRWIFAVKDGRIKEHYKEFYAPHSDETYWCNEDGTVKDYILLGIWSQIIDHIPGGWRKVYLSIRHHDWFMVKDRFEPVPEKYSLEEAHQKILVNGIRLMFMFTERKWFNDRHIAPKNWEKIVDDYRKTYTPDITKEEKEKDIHE